MKKFVLSIPTLCHENWDVMKPEEKGRFCAACQKTVVDFTNMSDRQVVDFITKTKNVCGRFNTTQLQREIAVPRKPVPWARPFFQLTLPAFLLSLNASAQGEVKVESIVCGKRVKDLVVPSPKLDTAAGATIKGIVVDEKRRPITGATVALEKIYISPQTNEHGLFRFMHVKESKVTLAVSSVGYESKTVVVNVKDSAAISIVQLSEAVLGGLVYVECVKPKMGKVSAVPLPETNDTEPAFSRFSVFPNPATSHSAVTVEAMKIKNGSYQLAIVNNLGIAVQTNEVVFDKNIKRVMLELKDLAAGQYFVQLTHRKSGKVFTEKIIVR